MLMSKEIWATETPSSAGAICARMRLTPGWRQARSTAPGNSAMRGAQPMAASAGSCTSACSTPPTTTPPASAITGSRPQAATRGTPHPAAAITLKFNSTGVTAGTVKRCQVFRMPAASATIDMKPM